MKRANQRHRIVFFYVTFIILIAISFYFVYPFLQAVVAAMILAFIFYPIQKIMQKRIGKGWSAFIITIFVLLLILVPFGFIINEIVKESTVTFISLKQKLASPVRCEGGAFCSLIDTARSLTEDPRTRFYISDSIERLASFVTDKVSGVIISLPKMVVNIFITMIGFYYFLKDGPALVRKMENVLPLKKENRQVLFQRFVSISKAIVFGYMVTALVQGLVALVGFYIVNFFFSSPGSPLIATPLLWAVVLAVLSMVPMLGSGFVWVPMSLYIIFLGYSSDVSRTIFGGVFLFFYGLILISNIDNVIRPILSGRKAKIHPLVIFLGIFGGLATFGLMGMVMGPLILALLLSYIKMYEEGRV